MQYDKQQFEAKNYGPGNFDAFKEEKKLVRMQKFEFIWPDLFRICKLKLTLVQIQLSRLKKWSETDWIYE